jgi:hypothetical protein
MAVPKNFFNVYQYGSDCFLKYFLLENILKYIYINLTSK